MLQNLGDKLKGHRWLAYLVLGPLVLIFAIWGAYGVVSSGFGAPDYGLKVNGERISANTLNRAWQNEQVRYVQATGGAPLGDAQKSALQHELLQQFTRETLLRQNAQAAGYRVSDNDVMSAYQNEPAFQVDGKFDATAAKSMLAQAGLTAESYETQKRDELLVGQLTNGILASEFLTPVEMARLFALQNEQRELRYALLPAERFAAAVKVDDAKIKAWYDAHAKDYLSAESVRLKYAELTLSAIASQLTVGPTDLQEYYDAHKDRYGVTETRHTHHILIALEGAKDAKADAAALAKAQDIRTQIQAGKDFGELAKKYSADTGSALQGGDLGWAQSSNYVPAFAAALDKLHVGEVSQPVKTEYGYHIIRLDEVKGGQMRTLDQAHAEIEADYRHDKAAEIFGDRQEKLQQKLEGGTAADFDAIAKEFSLSGGEIAQFTRTAGAAPLGAKPDLLQAVFSADSLAGDRIGGPVALADDHIVIYRVLEHHAPAPLPIAAVRDQIVAAIRKSEGAAAAKAAADAALAQVQAGASFDSAVAALAVPSAAATFVGRNDAKIPVPVRDAAFALPAPTAGKPAYRALATDDGGAALIAVTAVQPGKPGGDASVDQKLASQTLHRDGSGDVAAYVLELERHANVQRNPNVFE